MDQVRKRSSCCQRSKRKRENKKRKRRRRIKEAKMKLTISCSLPISFKVHTETNHRASLSLWDYQTLPDILQLPLIWVAQTRYAIHARVIVRLPGPFPTASTNPQLSSHDLSLQPSHLAELAPVPLHRVLRYLPQTPSMK